MSSLVYVDLVAICHPKLPGCLGRVPKNNSFKDEIYPETQQHTEVKKTRQ